MSPIWAIGDSVERLGMKNITADTPPNLPRPNFLESLYAEERAESLGVSDTIVDTTRDSPFPTFLESVYEEERAIELMLRAHESGDQGRVSELNDYILTLRRQSASPWGNGTSQG